MGFLDVEPVFAIHINVGIPGWPDMGQIAFLHSEAFPLELRHHGG
jgi:hypothetical protein